MKKNEIRKQMSTPLGAPAFPSGPYYFHNREYLNILYRTDMEALRRVVPEPLEIDEPLVKFEIIYMPDVTGLGAYTESGQVIPVSFNGEKGEYIHAMYVNNHPAIASGREMGAFPKKLGSPRLYVDSDTLVGALDYGSLRVATATMGYKHQPLDVEQARQELLQPIFMLKIVPNYDGSQKVCQLMRTQIKDLTIHGAWTAPARLQMFAHALAPIADLPVLEIVSASHIITDVTLAMPELIYDYLAEE
jgi:acetoacetate decarboxylase